MSEAKMGHVIAIEGNNGVGKTEQIARVATNLREQGHDVLVVAEPGGTALGLKLRAILKDQREIPLNNTTELLLFAAQRDDLYRTMIRPALDAGKVVLADRSYFSTYAFQVAPYVNDNGLLLQLFNLVTAMNVSHLGQTPIIVVNLAMPEEQRLARLAGIDGREQDSFESLPAEILEKVNQAYVDLEQQPGVHTVDATLPRDEVTASILEHLSLCMRQREQEADLRREYEAKQAEQPEAEAKLPTPGAEPEQPMYTLEEAHTEILNAIEEHSGHLIKLYGKDFAPHEAEFEAHKENLRQWAALHIEEQRAKGDSLDAMTAQRMIMSITNNIGTMLGGWLTLLNIGDMVKEKGAGSAAPAAEAQEDNASTRGQTDTMHTFEDAGVAPAIDVAATEPQATIADEAANAKDA